MPATARTGRTTSRIGGSMATVDASNCVAWSVESNEKAFQAYNQRQLIPKKKQSKFPRSGNITNDYKMACNWLGISCHPGILEWLDPTFTTIDPMNVTEGLLAMLQAKEKRLGEDESAGIKDGNPDGKTQPPPTGRNRSRAGTLSGGAGSGKDSAASANQATDTARGGGPRTPRGRGRGKRGERKARGKGEVEQVIDEMRLLTINLDLGSLKALRLALPYSTIKTIRLWDIGMDIPLLLELVEVLKVSPVEHLSIEENPLPPYKPQPNTDNNSPPPSGKTNKDSKQTESKQKDVKRPVSLPRAQSGAGVGRDLRDDPEAKANLGLKSPDCFFAKLLDKGSPLVTLTLRGNLITNSGLKSIFVALKNNSNLKYLNLGNNLVGSGLEEIILHQGSSLCALNLSRNRIDDKTAVSVAKVWTFKKNKKRLKDIQLLDLSHNKMQDRGCVAVLDAVETCDAIKRVRLSGNEMSPETALRALQVDQPAQKTTRK